MVDIALAQTAPLGNFHRAWPSASLDEIADYSIVSLAHGGDIKQKNTLVSNLGVEWPLPGKVATSATEQHRLLGLQTDQIFILFQRDGLDPISEISASLDGKCYLTDQSDSWAILSLSGKNSRLALERICPVDLATDVFPVGAVARTQMEHLGVIIARTGDDDFLLLSARSSARSFLHAVSASIEFTQ
jgi:sarcosine oxidase subunit gamma